MNASAQSPRDAVPKSKSKSFVKTDPELVDKAPAISVFIACFALVHCLENLDTEAVLAEEESAHKPLAETAAQLLYTAEAIHRFDVILPVLDGELTINFWRWYNWWLDFMGEKSLADLAVLRLEAGRRSYAARNVVPSGDWMLARRDAPIRGFKLLASGALLLN